MNVFSGFHQSLWGQKQRMYLYVTVVVVVVTSRKVLENAVK